MKIKIALIPNEHTIKSQELCTKLQIAMNTGMMNIVDQTTKELFLLIDGEFSTALLEEQWLEMMGSIRLVEEDFRSDYLLNKEQIKTIITADLCEPFELVLTIANQALTTDCQMLQLPFEDEDHNVR